jgi:hypothetical protein
MVLEFIYFNINQGWQGEKIGIFWGVFNTDNDSRHFQRQIAVTKPKAIHFSTQSTEKHHKEKNILNIYRVRLNFLMFLLGKQRFLAKVILRVNVGCYKMSDTCFLLKALKTNRLFWAWNKAFIRTNCLEMLLFVCSNEIDNLIFRYST